MFKKDTSTTELSPFSRLKQSPLKNLIPPKNDRRNSFPDSEYSPVIRGPLTRSRTGIPLKKPRRLEEERDEELLKKSDHSLRITRRRGSAKDTPRQSHSQPPPRKHQKFEENYSLSQPVASSSKDFQSKASTSQAHSSIVKISDIKSGKTPISSQNFRFTLNDNNPNKEIPEFNPKVPPPAIPGRNQASTVPTNSTFDLGCVFGGKANIPATGAVLCQGQTFRTTSSMFTSTPHIPVKKPDFNFISTFQASVNNNNAAGSTSFQVSACGKKNQSDQEILDDFLKKHGYDAKKSLQNAYQAWTPMDIDENDKKMTIELAQAILTQCYKSINKMTLVRTYMEKNIDLITDYEWEIKKQQLENHRKEILETLDPLMVPSAIEALQKRLKKKQANRAWVHERNSVYRSEKQMLRDRRERTKEFIDEWNAKLEKLEMEKRDKEVEKKAALQLLEKVKMKIKETNEFIGIFYRLKELSLARIVADQNSSQAAEEFNRKMDELSAVWKDLLLEYEEEKITLDTIIDRRSSNEPLPPPPKTLESKWLEAIFGPASIYDTQNRYLIAERNMTNFIEIRRQWDKSIVQNPPPNVGSCIPVFWALPSPNPTSKWRSYRCIMYPQVETKTQRSNLKFTKF